MYLPELNVLNIGRDTLQVFGGYNHKLRINDGEFYDMENCTSDFYPILSPRCSRGAVETVPYLSYDGLLSKNLLWYAWAGQLKGIDPSTKKSKIFDKCDFYLTPQLVSYSSYIVDMANHLWFSTLEDENGELQHGSFSYKVNPSSYFSVYICDEEGNSWNDVTVGDVSPDEAADQTHWLDTYSSPAVLNRYYNDNKGWFEVPYYLRITFETDENPIQKGDWIRLKAPYVSVNGEYDVKIADLENAHEVILSGTNEESGKHYIVIKAGICKTSGYTIADAVKVDDVYDADAEYVVTDADWQISNNIPAMDFVVEANNRLWGCRYGLNNEGKFVNEIYASKLGSFRVWEKFEGISDDSYMVSCGTDGPFTGAINYNGQPIFFKENCMHRVYGTFPFQVTPVVCNGVQKGSERSLAVVNNVLFYKSPTGICTYSGALPTLLELPFGGISYTDAFGAGTQTKYYLAMTGADKQVLFVYDTKNGLLHKENNQGIYQMVSYKDNIYATVANGDATYSLVTVDGNGNYAPLEKQVSWYAETGIIGLSLPDKKYITCLDIRMSLAVGSEVSISVQYDSAGDWEHIHTMTGNSMRSFNLPIRVKRCDHLRLRIAGKGDAKVYSITKTIEQGSNR